MATNCIHGIDIHECAPCQAAHLSAARLSAADRARENGRHAEAAKLEAEAVALYVESLDLLDV